ncbi:hypothetical protein E2I00_007827, partial [Balaenoptera physalus]
PVDKIDPSAGFVTTTLKVTPIDSRYYILPPKMTTSLSPWLTRSTKPISLEVHIPSLTQLPCLDLTPHINISNEYKTLTLKCHHSNRRPPEEVSHTMKLLYKISHESLRNYPKLQGMPYKDLQELCTSIDSLANVVLNNSLAIEYLLAEYNTQGPDPSYMWNMIKQSFPSLTWFLPFLGPPTAITLLLIFGPCLLNCLVNFVSKWLEATKLQMILIQKNKQLRLWSGGNQTYF